MISEKECLFCKMSSGEIPIEKVLETENFFVVRDKFPKSEGHCLIISKKHYENILELPSILGTELITLTKEVCLLLAKEIQSQGFNLVQNNFKAAGQEINHFHLHIIPRKENDEVKLN